MDFLKICHKNTKNGVEVFPKFVMKCPSDDLMIRGSDFYAIWDERNGRWSTSEQDAIRLIDNEIDKYIADKKLINPDVKYMWDADSGMIDKFHKYCQKQMRDGYTALDETLVYSDMKPDKKLYASKCLPYALKPCDTPGWNKLLTTLYDTDEAHKIEWAIGSIVTGDSKEIQKFMVFYGSAGTGKSTIMNIIADLFEGYYCSFDAKALGSASAQFALEPFRSGPLVAIQHDGDLSRIEDNTRINSLVSHEEMQINEKFKSAYSNRFKCFLFMGTNRYVKITDSKSGILRRLIDVHPSGRKLPKREYNAAMKQVQYELGGIAYKCRDVYLNDPDYYDDYVPRKMMSESNDFYNYVVDAYDYFSTAPTVPAKSAWDRYKTYCEEAKVPFPLNYRLFIAELQNYFWGWDERERVFSDFRTDIFNVLTDKTESKKDKKDEPESWLKFERQDSVFDCDCATYPAQYATTEGTPARKWENVKTTLMELDTHRLHYVKVPAQHIVIDFDIPDENGKKSLELNLKEASKWPPTYAELSKSGAGIHLHYIYTGDVSKLSRMYNDKIEVKVFTGNSSLRRMLSLCNDLAIATISSNLPLKEIKMIDQQVIKDAKHLRSVILKNLRKEIHPGTKPSVDFIYKLLEDAYNSGMHYDVSDLENDVFAFATQSTNHADYCMKLVMKMKFKSDEPANPIESSITEPMVFFDMEILPNVCFINAKKEGLDAPMMRFINPSPREAEMLMTFKLVGYNCINYDNHMLWAIAMGYTNMQLYKLSKKIINSKKGDRNNGTFIEARHISYTDVFDFASAGNKKSLKKLEIEMTTLAKDPNSKLDDYTRALIKKVKHHELGLDWDKPVPEHLWPTVSDYCDDDVYATEAGFHYLKGDWVARQIMADISGLTVNHTTNALSQAIVFGKNKKPQSEFNYRDLSKPVPYTEYYEMRERYGEDYDFRVWDADGMPCYRSYVPDEALPDGYSIMPFFPNYRFEDSKSYWIFDKSKFDYAISDMVEGVDYVIIGEGGRVYAIPGMYGNVWDGDVTGMHPSTMIIEVLFGPRYTKAFKAIFDGRVSIKHQAWDDIDGLFDGKLKPYIQKVKDGELTSKELAKALKTVVNSAYGLTSASFENPFRDPRNKDNIVAKRGALFMTLLTEEVKKRGYVVAHNKTDSIKIPDADEAIIDFVLKFGKEYGYSFETEAEFEKFCLVNNAVYIAKTKDGEWTATGEQFAVPYVFKTLFSKQPLNFVDFCETFSVTKGALHLDFNERLGDVSEYELVKETRHKSDKLTRREQGLLDKFRSMSDEELDQRIGEGHDLKFIGRVGQFTPVKAGEGGGILYRVADGKNFAATGSKGYRWLESNMAEKVGGMDIVDKSYYTKLVDDAVAAISKYGDFEYFVSDDPYIPKPKLDSFLDVPWDAPDEGLPFI